MYNLSYTCAYIKKKRREREKKRSWERYNSISQVGYRVQSAGYNLYSKKRAKGGHKANRERKKETTHSCGNDDAWWGRPRSASCSSASTCEVAPSPSCRVSCEAACSHWHSPCLDGSRRVTAAAQVNSAGWRAENTNRINRALEEASDAWLAQMATPTAAVVEARQRQPVNKKYVPLVRLTTPPAYQPGHVQQTEKNTPPKKSLGCPTTSHGLTTTTTTTVGECDHHGGHLRINLRREC